MIQRLQSLEIEAYRVFKDRFSIPLDGNLVLVYGPNGAGKSSFLNAIEYGLTGAVQDLQRFSDDYPRCLQHLGTPGPHHVSVRVQCNDGQIQKFGAVNSEESSSEARRMLPLADRRHFVERCYLSQARLARLLEIYQSTDNEHSEQPLVRFVRELLGLDLLENITTGLHQAGHKKRLEKELPPLKRLYERANQIEAEIDQQLTIRGALQERLRRLIADLEENFSEHLPNGTAPSEVKAFKALRDQILESGPMTGRSGEAQRLQRLHGKITGALQVLAATEDRIESPLRSAGAHLVEIEHEIAAIEERLRPVVANGEDVLRSLDLLDEHYQNADDLGQRLSALWALNEHGSSRSSAAIGSYEANRRELERELDVQSRLVTQLAALPDSISSVAQSQKQWIDALRVSLSRLDGNDCPVCKRDFSELGTGSLRGHISAELEQLGANVERLQNEAKQREHLLLELANCSRRTAALQSTIEKAQPEYERCVAAREQLSVLRAKLRQASEDHDTWKRLTVERAAAIADLESLAVRQRQRDDASGVIRQVNAALNPGADKSPRDVELAQQLERQIRKAIQDVENAAISEQRLIEELQRAEAAAAELQSANLDHDALMLERVQIAEAVSQVERIVRSGRSLRDAAAAAQSKLLNQLFSDTLNSLWRDLFGRLVKSERFVPHLNATTGARGKIHAGIMGVSDPALPFQQLGSILSMGNLNTAALTLFLSLNLIEQPRHRVLVFDDPVQNMDDIHVVNLAGLLRSVAYEADRQIVVAVHERALFEYLKVEFAPTRESERVVTIELSRGEENASNISTQIIEWQPEQLQLTG